MKLVPLGDRVVLKELEAEETTKSGIILPDKAQEKPQQAEVVAVGPGGMVDGKRSKMEVKKGRKTRLSIPNMPARKSRTGQDEKYVIVKQSDILAVC
jgi:chaperonin GroES